MRKTQTFDPTTQKQDRLLPTIILTSQAARPIISLPSKSEEARHTETKTEQTGGRNGAQTQAWRGDRQARSSPKQKQQRDQAEACARLAAPDTRTNYERSKFTADEHDTRTGHGLLRQNENQRRWGQAGGGTEAKTENESTSRETVAAPHAGNPTGLQRQPKNHGQPGRGTHQCTEKALMKNRTAIEICAERRRS
jgi:Ni/Co efflux regulator RcnB